jgi:hypothetical protein
VTGREDDKNPARHDDQSIAESMVALWSNLVAMVCVNLLETGKSRSHVLQILSDLQDTNDATVGSPFVREAAARHLMSVYGILAGADRENSQQDSQRVD